MSDPAKERVSQNEVSAPRVASGRKRGATEKCDRALALYPEAVVGFVRDTQPEQRQKFCTL
jgi:type I restriction enzyme R subunit